MIFCKHVFCNPYSEQKYTTSFQYKTTPLTIITLCLLLLGITHAILIEQTDTYNYLTNIMVSHYDCAKQHKLRQFNLLIVKQGTGATSNIHDNGQSCSRNC